MANQAIALQARAPQTDILGGAIRNNAQLINTMSQQRAAERQNAMAQQQMQLAQAKEAREAALAGPQMDKARSEAFTAEQKNVLGFFDLAAEGMKRARNAEDAIKIGDFLKSRFAGTALEGVVDQTLASLPQDPSQFQSWRQQTLNQSLNTKDQLEQDFTTQNLGTSTRVIATPKFAGAPGGGGARVVEGSEADVAFKPTVVNVEGIGAVIVDPNTGKGYPAAAGDVGGFQRPNLVGGPRGGADTVYGNGKFAQPPKPLTQSTIGEVQDFQRTSLIPATRGKVGAGPSKGTGAVGTYQITYGTLKDYAPKVLGDNWRNTPFTADVQERIAKAIYDDVKGGNLKDTWAGLPANKPGAYANVPWEQVRGKIAQVESGGAAPAPAPAKTAAPKTLEEAVTQKAFNKVLPIIGFDPKTGKNRVADLISASTSGGVEMIGSDVVGFTTGKATPGRVALAELRTIADNMTFEKLRGKLGAQISNADVQLIARTMADIANGNTPANERAAAWNNVVLPLLLRGAGVEAPAGSKPRNSALDKYRKGK